MTAPIVFQTPAVMFLKIWHWERELTTVQPAPFLIFIIDSRTWIVKHKNTKEKAQKEMTAQRFQPVAVITFVMLDWWGASRLHGQRLSLSLL